MKWSKEWPESSSCSSTRTTPVQLLLLTLVLGGAMVSAQTEWAATFLFAGLTSSKTEHVSQRRTDRDKTLTQPVIQAVAAKDCLQHHLHSGLM